MNKRTSGIFDVNNIDLPDLRTGGVKSREEDRIRVIKSELERLNSIIEKKDIEIESLNQKIISKSESAKKQGFNEGYEKSKEDLTENFEIEFNKKISDYSKDIDNRIKDLIDSKKEVILDSEESIIDLIFTIVNKIVHHEISIDKQIIIDVVKNALPAIDAATNIEIIAHPDDIKTLKKFENLWMALTMKRDNVSYVEKDNIQQGGLLISTNLGTVDVQLETVLENLKKSILDHQKTVKIKD